MTEFVKTDWRTHDRHSRSALWKRLLYKGLRPAYDWQGRRELSAKILKNLKPGHVLFERGLPLEDRRAWGAKMTRLQDARILVQGTGTGWDVLSWAELRPKTIIATDLFEFALSWEEIARHCRDRFKVKVEFRAAPMEDHAFIAAGSIDLVTSDAVYEHCRDLRAVMHETRRLVKPNGRIVSSYGPLWYGPGGDHYSGRGGLAETYNHVLLPEDAYRAYFKSHLIPSEDFQSGGRYVELDLFSRLSSKQYFDIYHETGFNVEDSWFYVASKALAYRKTYPDRWRQLLTMLPPALGEDDLLIWAHLVRLKPIY